MTRFLPNRTADAMRLNESRILAMRWCVKPKAVEKWMRDRAIWSALEFRDRWPGEWAESDNAALTDFWDYSTEPGIGAILAAGNPPHTEPTPQGNQYVIPGCERDKSRGPTQADLF